MDNTNPDLSYPEESLDDVLARTPNIELQNLYSKARLNQNTDSQYFDDAPDERDTAFIDTVKGLYEAPDTYKDAPIDSLIQSVLDAGKDNDASDDLVAQTSRDIFRQKGTDINAQKYMEQIGFKLPVPPVDFKNYKDLTEEQTKVDGWAEQQKARYHLKTQTDDPTMLAFRDIVYQQIDDYSDYYKKKIGATDDKFVDAISRAQDELGSTAEAIGLDSIGGWLKKHSLSNPDYDNDVSSLIGSTVGQIIPQVAISSAAGSVGGPIGMALGAGAGLSRAVFAGLAGFAAAKGRIADDKEKAVESATGNKQLAEATANDYSTYASAGADTLFSMAVLAKGGSFAAKLAGKAGAPAKEAVKKSFGEVFKSIGKDAALEGATEAFQGVIDDADMAAATNLYDRFSPFDLKKRAYEFLVGGVAGGLVGTAVEAGALKPLQVAGDIVEQKIQGGTDALLERARNSPFLESLKTGGEQFANNVIEGAIPAAKSIYTGVNSAINSDVVKESITKSKSFLDGVKKTNPFVNLPEFSRHYDTATKFVNKLFAGNEDVPVAASTAPVNEAVATTQPATTEQPSALNQQDSPPAVQAPQAVTSAVQPETPSPLSESPRQPLSTSTESQLQSAPLAENQSLSQVQPVSAAQPDTLNQAPEQVGQSASSLSTESLAYVNEADTKTQDRNTQKSGRNPDSASQAKKKYTIKDADEGLTLDEIGTRDSIVNDPQASLDNIDSVAGNLGLDEANKENLKNYLPTLLAETTTPKQKRDKITEAKKVISALIKKPSQSTAVPFTKEPSPLDGIAAQDPFSAINLVNQKELSGNSFEQSAARKKIYSKQEQAIINDSNLSVQEKKDSLAFARKFNKENKMLPKQGTFKDTFVEKPQSNVVEAAKQVADSNNFRVLSEDSFSTEGLPVTGRATSEGIKIGKTTATSPNVAARTVAHEVVEKSLGDLPISANEFFGKDLNKEARAVHEDTTTAAGVNDNPREHLADTLAEYAVNKNDFTEKHPALASAIEEKLSTDEGNSIYGQFVKKLQGTSTDTFKKEIAARREAARVTSVEVLNKKEPSIIKTLKDRLTNNLGSAWQSAKIKGVLKETGSALKEAFTSFEQNGLKTDSYFSQQGITRALFNEMYLADKFAESSRKQSLITEEEYQEIKANKLNYTYRGSKAATFGSILTKSREALKNSGISDEKVDSLLTADYAINQTSEFDQSIKEDTVSNIESFLKASSPEFYAENQNFFDRMSEGTLSDREGLARLWSQLKAQPDEVQNKLRNEAFFEEGDPYAEDALNWMSSAPTGGLVFSSTGQSIGEYKSQFARDYAALTPEQKAAYDKFKDHKATLIVASADEMLRAGILNQKKYDFIVANKNSYVPSQLLSAFIDSDQRVDLSTGNRKEGSLSEMTDRSLASIMRIQGSVSKAAKQRYTNSVISSLNAGGAGVTEIGTTSKTNSSVPNMENIWREAAALNARAKTAKQVKSYLIGYKDGTASLYEIDLPGLDEAINGSDRAEPFLDDLNFFARSMYTASNTGYLIRSGIKLAKTFSRETNSSPGRQVARYAMLENIFPFITKEGRENFGTAKQFYKAYEQAVTNLRDPSLAANTIANPVEIKELTPADLLKPETISSLIAQGYLTNSDQYNSVIGGNIQAFDTEIQPDTGKFKTAADKVISKISEKNALAGKTLAKGQAAVEWLQNSNQKLEMVEKLSGFYLNMKNGMSPKEAALDANERFGNPNAGSGGSIRKHALLKASMGLFITPQLNGLRAAKLTFERDGLADFRNRGAALGMVAPMLISSPLLGSTLIYTLASLFGDDDEAKKTSEVAKKYLEAIPDYAKATGEVFPTFSFRDPRTGEHHSVFDIKDVKDIDPSWTANYMSTPSEQTTLPFKQVGMAIASGLTNGDLSGKLLASLIDQVSFTGSPIVGTAKLTYDTVAGKDVPKDAFTGAPIYNKDVWAAGGSDLFVDFLQSSASTMLGGLVPRPSTRAATDDASVIGSTGSDFADASLKSLGLNVQNIFMKSSNAGWFEQNRLNAAEAAGIKASVDKSIPTAVINSERRLSELQRKINTVREEKKLAALKEGKTIRVLHSKDLLNEKEAAEFKALTAWKKTHSTIKKGLYAEYGANQNSEAFKSGLASLKEFHTSTK